LSDLQLAHLGELVTEWQLLADLSFADLTLWAPLRRDAASWPEGHIAIAHIRPTTTSTCYTNDPIGSEIRWGSNSRIDEALSSGEIVRDNQEQRLNEFTIKEEAIPVNHDGQVIAVISRVRNIETMRTPSQLELNYREIANQINRMISQGTFPIAGNVYLSESAPRVGDGLVRLGLDGSISYASPNALSAFNRLGWKSELRGENLGAVIDSLPKPSFTSHIREASEESWPVAMSGKLLRRAEFENDQGTIDLFAIPLLEGAWRDGSDRVGAMVLVRDVTELRRRSERSFQRMRRFERFIIESRTIFKLFRRFFAFNPVESQTLPPRKRSIRQCVESARLPWCMRLLQVRLQNSLTLMASLIASSIVKSI
jgi:PAS domain-containing protein